MPTTLDLDTISAVLLRQLRGNYPGIANVTVGTAGSTLTLDFEIGEGAVPSGTRGLGAAAVGRLRVNSPAVLRGIDTVTVSAQGQTDTYSLDDLESNPDPGPDSDDGPF